MWLFRSLVPRSTPETTRSADSIQLEKNKQYKTAPLVPQLHTVTPLVRGGFSVVVSLRLHCIAPQPYNTTATRLFGGCSYAIQYAVKERLRLMCLFCRLFAMGIFSYLKNPQAHSSHSSHGSCLAVRSRVWASFCLPQPRPAPLTKKITFLYIGIISGYFFVSLCLGVFFSSLLEHKIKIAPLRKLRSTIFISCFFYSDYTQVKNLKK